MNLINNNLKIIKFISYQKEFFINNLVEIKNILK